MILHRTAFTVRILLAAAVLVPALAAGGFQLFRHHDGALSRAESDSPATGKSDKAGSTRELILLARAVESKPDHTTLLLQLAQFESGNRKFGDAERHLREVLRREPDNADARLELGKVLFQLGNVRGALEQNQLILKQHPVHSGALYNLGAIYANIGNANRASEYWSRLLALEPHSQKGMQAGRMLSQLKTGKN